MTRIVYKRARLPKVRVGSIVRTEEGRVFELAECPTRTWFSTNRQPGSRTDETMPLPVEVLWEPEPEPIILPTKPGTVIAIGEWWLVRLRPYNNEAASAWELLAPQEDVAKRMRSLGVDPQCIYGDEWVLAEVEQEGDYRIIATPQDAS